MVPGTGMGREKVASGDRREEEGGVVVMVVSGAVGW